MATAASNDDAIGGELMPSDDAWCQPCAYGPGAVGGPWMPEAGGMTGGVEHMLPFWEDKGETPEACHTMLEIYTQCCPDFRRGYCTKGKGKAGHCFFYHFESQARRPPIDAEGRLRYWDVQCPNLNSEMGYCPNGDMCAFAHGRNEVSYHPAKYKTRMCNGTECRGESVCCFAHSEEDLRPSASERFSFISLVSMGGGPAGGSNDVLAGMGIWTNAGASSSFAGAALPAPMQQKHRFCASYPHVSQCRRGTACAFAHSREEAITPLLSVEEEEHNPSAMTHQFFTEKFKTLWCPIGAQHDWQNCPYAHTYQDARRKPDIGYGPQPCPYWSKKDTRVAYAQRCPLGLRCPYSHGAKEQLYHPKYFRTVICRDLQLKGCPRQTLCAFFHRRQERRTAEADNVDYMQPLDKENLSAEWSQYFLAPPFFQESANEGGGASGSGGMGPQGMGMPRSKGMQMNGGKGMGGGMQMPVMKGGMPPANSTWYAGYLAGMANLANGSGMPGMQGGRMPKRQGADGGSRTPTTAESDGGHEETEEMMPFAMVDPMSGWGAAPQMHGFPAGVPGQQVWGGMPFYGAPGGFVAAPYSGKGYWLPSNMGNAELQEDGWYGPQ